jgi:hypothetical protein
MSKNKSKKRKKQQPSPQIYCEDCGELLDRTSTYYLVAVREQTNMPNIPAFCRKCRLKGYWYALTGSEERKGVTS